MYEKHKLFGHVFNVFSKFKVNDSLVTFILDDNGSFKGNLEYIKNELSNHGEFEYSYFNKNFLSIKSLKKLAQSKYVFLNDNFLAMAFMNFNKKTIICQLWHAPGAFKKFGASVSSSFEEIEMIKKANEKTSYLITTSSQVSKYYSDAFQIDSLKIKPLGLPRADYYFKNHDLVELRKNFNEKYPIASGKKIILYAPTFRDDEKFNNVFEFLDLEKFNEELGEDYALALRLHPKIKKFYSSEITSKSQYIDVTDFEDEQELMLICDMMVTDYSSIMIEFALLKKPIVFFAYDYDSYLDDDRGFYFDYPLEVPGEIVKTTDELINVVKKDDFDEDRLLKFLHGQFDCLDGNSSKRVVEFLLNKER